MKKRLTFLALLMACTEILAQDFTIENELAKQRKRYPTIEPYAPSSEGISVTEDITYATIDGQAVTMDIVRCTKRDGTRLTPIAIIHGGGWCSGDKVLDRPMATELAKHGCVAFCINYRMADEHKFPAAVVDINRALAKIATMADSLMLDMSRLTVMGTSAGGQLAALIGATNGNVKEFMPDGVAVPRVDKVIDIDGVLTFIHPDSREGQDKPGKPSAATRWMGCTASENADLWNFASASSHIGEWSARRFAFFNSSHARFSAGQGDVMKRLEELGKSTESHKFDGTPHTFWLFTPWAPELMKKIIEEIAK